MLLLELLLEPLAHFHHGRHVDLVEGRQDGVGGLGLQQTLSHTGAQAAHGHALLWAVTQVSGRRCRHCRQGLGHCRGSGHGDGCRNSSRLRCSHRGQDVALGDTSILAGARHRTGGHLVVGHQLGGSGHGHASLGASGRSHRRRGCRDRRHHGSRCRNPGRSLGIDAGNHLITADGAATGHHQFSQHARGGRRNFQNNLVGLDLDQDFICGNGFASLLLPLQQGGFRHRLGQLRDFDIYDGHDGLGSEFVSDGAADYLVSVKPLSLPKAASMSAFC